MKVKELIDPVTLSWRFNVLLALYSEEEVSMIRSMPICFRLPADRLIWHFHNRGLYMVKSGYNVARKLVQSPSLSASTSNSDGNSYTKLWKSVWKAKVPPKVKVFVWKASQSILPTKVNLAKKGVSLEVRCAMCNEVPETKGDVLKECSFAWDVWFTSPIRLRLVSVRDNSIKEWLISLVDQHEVDLDIFCMLLWAVWQERNAKV
ncbi:hypothetical protein C1H46_000397 [Malus baccata]|uniref:Reverse transcriptase zinc-binding domain-containing protein n=1 Tax=Malus baccata TaxID=106549 RepID=A0A540NSN9_MALBA|nr:hypothetical protein C1H46_000397 [Malus baccata]